MKRFKSLTNRLSLFCKEKFTKTTKTSKTDSVADNIESFKPAAIMDTGDYCESIVPTTLTTPIDALDYNMCHRYRGICLILETEKFAPRGITKNLTRRVGSKADSKAIEALFTKLGFNVVLHRDLTSSGIKEALKQVCLWDHSDSDCFVCFVMTHGDHGFLYSHDSRYAIDHLFSNFQGNNCPSLVGKPKLFFIQACQGSRLDPGVVVATDALDAAHYFKIPTYADFLIAYSTLPGFFSFRNTDSGSWFIQALVQIIREYHLELDLLSMMTLVSHRVAYYYSSNAATQAQCGMKQVPCITSMLTRRVFLHPKSIEI